MIKYFFRHTSSLSINEHKYIGTLINELFFLSATYNHQHSCLIFKKSEKQEFRRMKVMLMLLQDKMDKKHDD